MAAVLAVVAVALVDAVRGREGAEEPPAETATLEEPGPVETAGLEVPPPDAEPPASLVARLRSEGIAGRLVVVDGECEVAAVSLPALGVAAAPPSTEACAAPSRTRAGACGPVVSPPCPARIRAGGDVVVVRNGALWAREAECARPLGRCWQELLSADDLRRTGVPEPRVVDHVWLAPDRAAVLLTWPGGGYVLGIYHGRTLVRSHRWGGEGPGRLEASPGGALLTARPARLFRGDGTPIALAPRFRNARALDWSPDGNWAALAMVGAVVLVPTQGLVGGAEAQRAIRLPYPARDLAWLPG